MSEKIQHTAGEYQSSISANWKNGTLQVKTKGLALPAIPSGELASIVNSFLDEVEAWPDCPGPKNLAIIQAAAGLAAAGKIVFSEHKRKAVHGPCICAFCEALAAYSEATI